MRFLLFAVPPAVLALSLQACSDDTTPPPASTDAGDAATDARSHEGHDTGTAVVDAGPPPIRCTDDELAANDRTDGGAFEITFLRAANPVQYTNHCVTVKVGASVTFSGSFVQHPLQAAGGDTPNPIPYTAAEPAEGKLVVVMPAAGTFGYECEFHPSSMFGAIRVVP